MSGVDILKVVGDHGLEARLRSVLRPEVEVSQVGRWLCIPSRDGIQVGLHRSGERIVHETGEVLFHQSDGRERGECRNQCGALLEDISAVLNGGDNRGVR